MADSKLAASFARLPEMAQLAGLQELNQEVPRRMKTADAPSREETAAGSFA
jgi:hypothetical protein